MSEESRAMRAPNALRRPNKFIAYMRKYWFVYMLVLPGLVFMLVFDYGPMYGILLAFKDYSPRLGVWGSPWAGLSHFREMLVDPNFIRAFKNTVLINLYNLAFGFTFNVFLALMINELKIKKVKPVVQTCVYLPYFLSWVIFAGLVQVFLEYPSSADIGGVVNQVIAALGGQPVDFLKNPAMFRTILVITNIIKTAGYSTIVYLAAISGIDPALYESAAIDGANRKDMLLHITIPRILPSVMIMLILQLASLFISNFDQVYNLYNNYVLSTGDVLSTYIYRISLGGSGTNFELSTAMNLVLNTMGLIVVLGANKFVEKLDVQGVKVNVIRSTAGTISESDVMLASASKAVIYGFSVRPDANVRKKAEEEGVEIRLHNIIYKAMEEMELAMKGLLAPVYEEVVIGQAEVRQTFKVSKIGTIAGCMVTDGKLVKDCKVRLIRQGIVVYDGQLGSLKRFQNDAKEVTNGYECGLTIMNFNDIKEGDLIEAYADQEVPQN